MSIRAAVAACVILAGLWLTGPPGALSRGCEYWAAPPPAGDDGNPGTRARPWATLDHASAQLLALGGSGCTVWFADGRYPGQSDLHERFSMLTSFRAANPYRAVLEHDGLVVELSGARQIELEGFEIRHSGPGAGPLMVYISGSEGDWSEQIVVRNNILHDSYNNDLLKIHNGARAVTVEGNIFYNQGPGEEHIDVNGVEEIAIQDNIFFNDFAGSGRPDSGEAHSFITIKDSTGNPSGELGSRRVLVRRNIFLNWEGRRDTFVQIGNDGKPYHEAVAVRLENNLLLGNSPVEVYAALGVRGVREVSFVNNTVVGDLPSGGYAFWADTKELNPPNQNIVFANNIWSDPTGTMGRDAAGEDPSFSQGNPATTEGLILDNNLYWNGGAPIPPGEVASPLSADRRRVVADPQLADDQAAILLPRWAGAAFLSGATAARAEFVRLALGYGALPEGSPAVGRADPALAPGDDLLGRLRGRAPAIGAYDPRRPAFAVQLFLPFLLR